MENLTFEFLQFIEEVPSILNCQKHNRPYQQDNKGRNFCRQCKSETDKIRRQFVKAALIKAHGGECCVCAYSKCSGGLEFHHRIPSEKEFDISNGTIKSLEKMFEESKKCILVCANCHREIHAELIDINLIPNYEIAVPDELLLKQFELIEEINISDNDNVPIAQLDRATAF